MQNSITKLGELVEAAQTILVLQPEKPDTDSLTSSLALEQILGDLGKEVVMYCQDELPRYIAYFNGADRVSDTFPDAFDLAIIVDTGSASQMSRTLEKYLGRLKKKPVALIDHHANRDTLPMDPHEVIDPRTTSTCEMVLMISQQLGWKVNPEAANLLVPGIIADTRNLSVATVTPESFRAVAQLMELGADVAASHEAYRKADQLSVELLQLKGRILSRVETHASGKIALVVVTPIELKQYAEIHDPSDLVIYDMQWAEGVAVAVVIRHYGGQSNKIKISTRAQMPVAAKACQDFGGGGHDRAAGCQLNDTPVEEVKASFIKSLTKHIHDYEALQHAQQD